MNDGVFQRVVPILNLTFLYAKGDDNLLWVAINEICSLTQDLLQFVTERHGIDVVIDWPMQFWYWLFWALKVDFILILLYGFYEPYWLMGFKAWAHLYWFKFYFDSFLDVSTWRLKVICWCQITSSCWRASVRFYGVIGVVLMDDDLAAGWGNWLWIYVGMVYLCLYGILLAIG